MAAAEEDVDEVIALLVCALDDGIELLDLLDNDRVVS